MKKLLCAGVFALAMIGLLPSGGSQARAMEIAGSHGTHASITI